jgi:hypothetical protein
VLSRARAQNIRTRKAAITHIVRTVESVLLQQKRMQLKGSKADPRAIANKYCAISLHYQNDAHKVGLVNVERLWRIRGDEMPRMPLCKRSLSLLGAVLTEVERVELCYQSLKLKISERIRQPLLNIVESGESMLQQQKHTTGRIQTIYRRDIAKSSYCATTLPCQKMRTQSWLVGFKESGTLVAAAT